MKPQRRSEKCAIVNRTVSFNIEDPFQAELLERSRKMTNFSAAVKRWLAAGEYATDQQFCRTGQMVQGEPRIEMQSTTIEEFDPISALF